MFGEDKVWLIGLHPAFGKNSWVIIHTVHIYYKILDVLVWQIIDHLPNFPHTFYFTFLYIEGVRII